MADCYINNAEVKKYVAQIRNVAENLKKAGDAFKKSYEEAVGNIKGESREALIEFFQTQYEEFFTSADKGLPATITSVAELLEANRTQFASVDHSIAESIKKAANGK